MTSGGGGSTGIEGAVYIDPFAILHNDNIGLCLDFVRPGTYRFVAGSFHLLKECYLEKLKNCVTTSTGAACSSVSCTKMLLVEVMVPQSFHSDLCRQMVMNNQIDVLYWAENNKVFDRNRVVNQGNILAAARSGNLRILQWLRNLAAIDGATSCDFDLQFDGNTGNLLTFLLSRRDCCCNKCAATSAAEGGPILVLEWRREEGYELEERFVSKAALNCQMKLCR